RLSCAASWIGMASAASKVSAVVFVPRFFFMTSSFDSFCRPVPGSVQWLRHIPDGRGVCHFQTRAGVIPELRGSAPEQFSSLLKLFKCRSAATEPAVPAGRSVERSDRRRNHVSCRNPVCLVIIAGGGNQQQIVLVAVRKNSGHGDLSAVIDEVHI